jgi:WD40 repeat protein
VVSVAFSPTGSFLAAGTTSGSAQLWNIASRTLVATLASGTDNPVSAVAFGRDGILAALTPGAVRLADINGISTIDGPSTTLTAVDTGTAMSVAFSRDGTLLAAGFSDSQVVVWNVARRKVLVRLLSAEESALTGAVAFSPAGHMLAVGTKNGTVVLLNVDSPRVTATLRPPDGLGNSPVDSVAFSPQGDTLAAGTGNGSVLLWKVASGQPVAPVQPGGNGDPAGSVAFSPTGQYLASGSGAGALLWAVASRELQAVLTLLDRISSVESLAFSPDGKLLAVATNSGAQLWNLSATTPSLTANVPGNASSVTFSADSTVLAIRTDDGVTIWDADTSQMAGVLPAGGANSAGGAVALSPLGTLIAAAAGNGQIQLWDTPYIADPVAYLCQRVGQSFPQATWTQLAQGVAYQRTC